MKASITTFHKNTKHFIIFFFIMILFCSCETKKQDAFRVVAFPSDVSVIDVVNALKQENVDNVISSENTNVEITDFVELLTVPLSEALNRIPKTDPRYSSFLDRLYTYFSFTDMDYGDFSVIYIPNPDEEIDNAVVRAMTEIGSVWAWNGSIKSNKKRENSFVFLSKYKTLINIFVLLLALFWFVFLNTRKPKLAWLYRLLLLGTQLILLFRPVPTHGIAFILNLSILFISCKDEEKGLKKLFSVYFLPLYIALGFLCVFDLLLIPFIICSFLLAFFVYTKKAKLFSFEIRKWVHKPPEFLLLIKKNKKELFLPVFRLALLPVLPMFLVLVLGFISSSIDKTNANIKTNSITKDILKLELSNAPIDIEYCFNEHEKKQFAFNYGRISEALVSTDTYTKLIRYEIVDGKLKLANIDNNTRELSDRINNKSELLSTSEIRNIAVSIKK